MKNNNFLLIFCGLFALIFLATFVSATYYDYNDVLLLGNNNSEVSINITNYFKAQRSIPDEHVVYINASESETISFAEFNSTIRAPIENFITSNGLTDTINYIVTTKGVPLRISGSGSGTSTTSASVDSELTLILGQYNSSINASGRKYSPYYSKNEPFSHQKFGIYLVTRLTGYNYTDTKSLIDKATNATNNGTFVLDADSSKDGGGYQSGNDWMRSAKAILEAKGYNVTLNTTTTYLTNQQNVLGYASWGSNDCCDADNGKTNNTWAKGALAETYVSTSARTFTPPPSYSQSLIADLVAEGVSGAKGYVYEPYLDAMAHPDILFERYTDGYSLADSYYMASAYLSWMDVIVGDPKAVILYENIQPTIVLESPLDGSRIRNITIVNMTVTDANLDSVWYSRNGEANQSLSDPFDIDASSWPNAHYNITVYANDTVGNLAFNKYQFDIDDVVGTPPRATYFDGNTTDFRQLLNNTNVTDVILERGFAGKIEFGNQTLNVSGMDLDTYVKIEHHFISVDSVNVLSLNVSANLSLYDVSYQYPVLFMNGALCPSDICTIISNSNNILMFNVTHFTNYSVGANANLAIWDETDSGMPYAGKTKYINDSVQFFANYTNTTSGEAITVANCNTSFTDSPDNSMAYNATSMLYEYTRNFSATGTYDFNISCNATGYEALNATDSASIGGIALSSCQNLTVEGGYYFLVSNVSSNATCFTILANNVTLDGNGYTINYSKTATGYAVNNTLGYNFTTIKNANILKNTTYSSSFAIYFISASNGTIQNNTITTSGSYGYGVDLQSSSNSNTIANNTITTSGTNVYSIYLEVSSNSNTIANNTITTSGTWGSGIYLDESSTNILTNNTITTSGSVGYGIFFFYADTNNISSNTITTKDEGIYLEQSSTNTLTNNTISTSGLNGHGVVLQSSSNSNNLTNNAIITANTNAYGVYIDSSTLNSITGGSVIATNSSAYYLRDTSTTNNFTATNFTALRNISFYDATSWFNYQNDSSQNIWLKTNASKAGSINRTLITWSQATMKLNDTNGTSALTMRYNITGTYMNSTYQVYNTSKGIITNPYNLTADTSGNLPSFTIALDGNTEIWIMDVSPPAISINSPENQSYLDSLWFNITLNKPGSWAAYSLDNSPNVTMENDALTHFWAQNTSMSEGSHYVIFYANDSSGRMGNASVYFTVDITPPLMEILLPENITYSSVEMTLNYTATDANLQAVWYEYNGTNTTLSENITFNALDNQQSTLVLYANDTAGNMNSTSLLFTIDTIQPFVEIILPENISYNSTSRLLNYTATDANLASVWYEYNNTNTTLSGNTVFTALENQSIITLYANDSAGNVNSTSVTFTVDVLPSSITVISPLTQTYYTKSVWFNITLSEAGSWAGYSLDGAENVSLTNSSQTDWSELVNVSAAGLHDVVFYANDTVGNMNESGIVYFEIDSLPPIVQIILPENTTYSSASRTLNYSALDTNPDSVWYEYNGTNTTLSGNTTFTALDNQQSALIVYANDTIGNINSTRVIFTIDTTAPVIAIANPTNASALSAGTTSTWINITTDENAVCRYNMTNSSFSYSDGTNFTNTGSTNHSFSYSGLSDGATYSIYYKCNDSYGNMNADSVYHIFSIGSPVQQTTTTTSSGGGGGITSAKTISYLSREGPITKIAVFLKSPLSGASVTVTKTESVPVSAPQEPVYQYINITKKNFNNSQINNATIDFKVNKSWILANGFTNVYLLHFDNGWSKLKTDLINSTVTMNYYRAYTNAFSYFAIVGEKAQAAQTVPPVVETPNEAVKEETVTTTEQPKEPQNTSVNTPEQTKPSTSYFAYVVAAVMMILVATFVLRKKPNAYKVPRNESVIEPKAKYSVPHHVKKSEIHKAKVAAKKDNLDGVERRLDEIRRKLKD